MEEGSSLMQLLVDLLQNVVARLPFHSLIRVSATCKAFHRLVRSPQVAHLCRTLLAPPWNCLVAFGRPVAGLVLLEADRMSVAALPGCVPPSVHYADTFVGPLLYCGCRCHRDQLWISNPFIGTCQLPPFPFLLPDNCFLFVGMTFHPSSGLYTVVTIFSCLCGSEILSVFRFCPQEDGNRWSKIKLGRSINFGFLQSPPISIKSTVFWPTRVKGILLAFNSKTQWCRIIGRPPLINLIHGRIIEACGQILVVGCATFFFQSMAIWELDPELQYWSFTSAMLVELWHQFLGMSAFEEADAMEPHNANMMDKYTFTSSGKLVFIIPSSRNCMAVYDLEQGSWELVEGLHPMAASNLTFHDFLPLQPGLDLP